MESVQITLTENAGFFPLFCILCEMSAHNHLKYSREFLYSRLSFVPLKLADQCQCEIISALDTDSTVNAGFLSYPSL